MKACTKRGEQTNNTSSPKSQALDSNAKSIFFLGP